MNYFWRLAKSAFIMSALPSVGRRAEVEDYPNRAIRFIVPFAAGGPADIAVRVLAQKLAESWGQPVVIDNRDGINGIVGTEIAAKAVPDGYTIVFMNSTYYINPSIYRQLPFDPVNDFAPVSLFASSPVVLVVNPTLPFKSVSELITFVKANPGQLKYTSGGAYGSPSHVAGELFNLMAGVDIEYVPSSKGHAAAGAALSEGSNVQLMFDAALSAMPYIKSGEWRALAVTATKRAATLPDVPTIAECGLTGYEVSPSSGVLAPAGTPEEIVTKLSREIARIVHASDVKERFRNDGKEPIGSTPQQFAIFIKAEIEKWAKVVKHAGFAIKDIPT